MKIDVPGSMRMRVVELREQIHRYAPGSRYRKRVGNQIRRCIGIAKGRISIFAPSPVHWNCDCGSCLPWTY